MAELVEEFVAALQDRAVSLQACLDTQDLAELTTLAHQLKGACGGYGFEIIGQAAATLDASAKTATTLTELTDQVRALVSLCRRATAKPEPTT